MPVGFSTLAGPWAGWQPLLCGGQPSAADAGCTSIRSQKTSLEGRRAVCRCIEPAHGRCRGERLRPPGPQ